MDFFSGIELVIIRSKAHVGRCVAVSAPPRHRARGIELSPNAAFVPALPAGIGKAINASVPAVQHPNNVAFTSDVLRRRFMGRTPLEDGP
jgi:hypothetical protein